MEDFLLTIYRRAVQESFNSRLRPTPMLWRRSIFLNSRWRWPERDRA